MPLNLSYLSGTKVGRDRPGQLQFQVVDLTEVQIPRAVLGTVPESVMREHTVIPLCCNLDGSVVVAMHAPFEYGVVDRLQFAINREVRVVMASQETIQSAIERHFG